MNETASSSIKGEDEAWSLARNVEQRTRMTPGSVLVAELLSIPWEARGEAAVLGSLKGAWEMSVLGFHTAEPSWGW